MARKNNFSCHFFIKLQKYLEKTHYSQPKKINVLLSDN